MRELVSANIVTREVLAHRHDPTWREVILLLIGHLVGSGHTAQATELIGNLLDADKHGSAAYYQTVALVGDMVEELGKTLGKNGKLIKQAVIAELATLVDGGHLNAKERVAAAFTLGRLGDPRIRLPEQPSYWCDCLPGSFWVGDERKGELVHYTLNYAFKIGRYPVTNAEYAQFLYSPDYADPRWWTAHAQAYLKDRAEIQPRLWDNRQFNQPNQPVVALMWYEAMAYCAWLSHNLGYHIRLPTSLEWERAARHTDERAYPWGNIAPTPEYANYRDSNMQGTTPVGCFPLGRSECGAMDLIGNMGEWLATRDDDRMNPSALSDCIPRMLLMRTYSDFRDRIDVMRCGARFRDFATSRGTGLGFRLCTPM